MTMSIDDLRSLAMAMPIRLSNGQVDHELHDVWTLVREADQVRKLAQWLTEPFEDQGITAVVGVEARGFLFGAMAAMTLGTGFVPVRKARRYLPGVHLSASSDADWEGKRSELQLQAHALSGRDRVLMVDDWYTTGNQGRAAEHLVTAAGASLVGVAVVVEEGSEGRLSSLFPSFHALLRWVGEDHEFMVSSSNQIVTPTLQGMML